MKKPFLTISFVNRSPQIERELREAIKARYPKVFIPVYQTTCHEILEQFKEYIGAAVFVWKATEDKESFGPVIKVEFFGTRIDRFKARWKRQPEWAKPLWGLAFAPFYLVALPFALLHYLGYAVWNDVDDRL
jgi:hypothetical protein